MKMRLKEDREGWKTADRWLCMKILCAVITAESQLPLFPSAELMSGFTPTFVWKTIRQKVTSMVMEPWKHFFPFYQVFVLFFMDPFCFENK